MLTTNRTTQERTELQQGGYERQLTWDLQEQKYLSLLERALPSHFHLFSSQLCGTETLGFIHGKKNAASFFLVPNWRGIFDENTQTSTSCLGKLALATLEAVHVSFKHMRKVQLAPKSIIG
jgi:hypothetical protein